MKPFALTTCKVIAVLAPIILVLPFALAEEPAGRMGEDYYGTDISAAILEANQNPRKLNYDNQFWYNRSTSKSFELPNMGSEEMEKERLEGALGATAAGEKNEANPELPGQEQAQLEQNRLTQNEKETNQQQPQGQAPVINIEQINLVPIITYEHLIGTTTATGINSQGTVTSTARP